MKAPLATLRQRGHTVSGYLDDFFTCAVRFSTCENSVQAMAALFTKLGFAIHPDKSIFRPTQVIEFLGFQINSVEMTVELPQKKKASLKKMINQLLSIKAPTIRFIAKVLGTIVAVFPASLYGPLHYRNLDHEKTWALQISHGDYEAPHVLGKHSVAELRWWKTHIGPMKKPIHQKPITNEMFCDASDTGWGMSFTSDVGGGWTEWESALHINAKELLAIYYGLRTFSRTISNSHIRI